jgi:DNA-directed RNA polymerase subunit M/transcription elongation factor TFIIS
MPNHGLLLTQKAEVKTVKLPDILTAAAIKTLLKKKESPDALEPYSYKGLTLYVFGFTTGKAGTENKHELPPPHDSTLFFGDILLVATKDKKSFASPTTFKPEDYEAFYTKAFGGFDELEEEEEEEEIVEEEVEAEPEAEEEEAEPEPEEEEVKPKRKSVKPVVAPSYASFVSIPPDQQLKEESVTLTRSKQRQTILETIISMFKDILNDTECANLERCIYNGSVREAERRHVARAWSHLPFLHLYQMHARHIASNFHPESYVGNKELFQRYKDGKVSFDDLCGMGPYDLFETRWKESFEQQQIREKRQLEGDKSMATDQFLCGRCHKRECTYYEMQTRSADEPMTIFINCLNCGKHWRQ